MEAVCLDPLRFARSQKPGPQLENFGADEARLERGTLLVHTGSDKQVRTLGAKEYLSPTEIPSCLYGSDTDPFSFISLPPRISLFASAVSKETPAH